jgi:hypothetical protein
MQNCKTFVNNYQKSIQIHNCELTLVSFVIVTMCFLALKSSQNERN